VRKTVRLVSVVTTSPTPDTLTPDKPKRIRARKHASGPTMWVCKKDGCTLDFGQRRDLERHQATAAVHAKPGAGLSVAFHILALSILTRIIDSKASALTANKSLLE
jgi:hypothetical protein